jgi:putative transposase
VFKGRHFDCTVILLCVRWYLAYNLSLRNLEEMMAERGIAVDHATVHRWVVRYSPELLERFNRRKRAVTKSWHVDETYIKLRGRWTYLYRAIDSNGDTVNLSVPRNCDKTAGRRSPTGWRHVEQGPLAQAGRMIGPERLRKGRQGKAPWPHLGEDAFARQ